MAPSGTPSLRSDPTRSPTDAVGPPGGSGRSAFAFVLAALVLTVTLGTWLNAHAERSAPAASTDTAVHETPTSAGFPAPVVSSPGSLVRIAKAFVESVNGCERLLVTRREVESALGFRTKDPAPGPAGGVFLGCEFAASFDTRRGGGQLVISAYTADAPPSAWGHSRPVQGIGDEAEFTTSGNRDGHVDGPEGATSMLQVRSGDLILRFDGGVSNMPEGSWTPYPLSALRQLAEDALTPLTGPTLLPASSEQTPNVGPIAGPSTRVSRTVRDISFSLSVPISGWEMKGSLYISKSTVGPQDAEAVIFWTSFPDGTEAYPCAHMLVRGPNVGPTAADLAAVVSTARGTELVSGPSDVTVGGRAAKHVVLTVREDVGCDPGFFYAWRRVWAGAFWASTELGDTIRVWIIDVDGTRLFIEAETKKDADPGLELEIQQIVRSIRFD
jgi:hypothetical protein